MVLTFLLVPLYCRGADWMAQAFADEKIVMSFEPIILVIAGYYLSRLPRQQDDRTLKQEINRQKQRADALPNLRSV